MTVKLTDQLVKKLVRDAKVRKDVIDAHLPGLILRVGPRKALWVVRHQVGAVFRRHPLGRVEHIPLVTARELAAQHMRAVAAGRDPAAEARKDRANTVEALATFYMETHAKVRKKSWANDQRIITRHVLPSWGTRLVSSITRRDVRERVETIRATAPVQANRVKALVSKLFAYAVEHDWIEQSPVMGVRLPTKERPRKRVLTMEEVGTFWVAVGDLERDGVLEGAHADQLRLRLLLGQRGGEIAAMRWQDIADGSWTQPDPKNGRTHVLPVTAELADVLVRQRARVPMGCPWVFPNAKHTGPDIHRAWRAVELSTTDGKATRGLEALGVADAKGHDLRRACATHMGRLKVSMDVISRLLNHVARGTMTPVYMQHTYQPELRDALAKWADAVRAAALEHKQKATATA